MMGREILVLILPALLLSGCIQPSESGSSGLIIDVFESDEQIVLSGEDIQLQLKITNTGSVPGRIRSVQMLNINPDEWHVRQGSCSSLAESVIAPGSFRSCSITYRAPAVPEGLATVYKPVIRVEYTYYSTAARSINIAPASEMRRIKAVESLQSSSTSTSGPVALSVEAKNPLSISNGQVSFPIKVSVDNTGGGTVCRTSCYDKSSWQQVSVYLRLDSTMRSDCGTTLELDLTKGRNNQFVCLLTTTASENLVERVIEVRADYNYLVEKGLVVKISNRKFES
ncbi:MAG: hypothetical protein HYX24_02710 [Candidatus Aenigmarchaeota archaeon]|nr:hypothetical protein [Candidatus Aenigmarchaeota archaeon]